jgi:hypothetical protein
MIHMLSWLRNKLQSPETVEWSVTVGADRIITRDSAGEERSILLAELRSVIVATDESGPWGYDVVFLLYSEDTEPLSIFPLEAEGCQEFVGWLSSLAGYDDREMARAMAATRVARFTVWRP